MTRDATKPAEAALAPLIGQLVWSVRRGVGTFLTMEFGEAHLMVREPVEPRAGTNAKVRRALRERRVTPTGEWHLWVQHADWRLATNGGAVASDWTSAGDVDARLRELDGQKLVGVSEDRQAALVTLRFDLGGTLEIRDTNAIAGDRWSIHRWNGPITTRTAEGTAEVERPSPAA